MMRELPEDVKSSGEASPYDWDQKEYLLADLIDAVQDLTFLTSLKLMDPKKARTAKPPKRYPRPGQKKIKPVFASPEKLGQLWGQ